MEKIILINLLQLTTVQLFTLVAFTYLVYVKIIIYFIWYTNRDVAVKLYFGTIGTLIKFISAMIGYVYTNEIPNGFSIISFLLIVNILGCYYLKRKSK